MSEKRLLRSRDNKMLFGVCAGVADYLNIDPVIVRLVVVLLTLWHGVGLLLYLALALIMPQEAEIAPKANAFDDEEIVIKGS
ncbi:MAG: PspC domain-containing protein [Anaerolineae bacterium]|nr:PspC domain-containing protein [Anaerolineae bacterium]HNS40188.1 PspC domain-containing protein [Promineifilum sp.]